MGTMASQITILAIVYSTVYSGVDQRKHRSSVSLAFVQGIHRWSVNSPHKGPVTLKMFPFDDVIMLSFSDRADLIKKMIYLKMFQSVVVSFHVKESDGFDTIPPFNQAYEIMLLSLICLNQNNPFLWYENNCLISSRRVCINVGYR